MTKIYLKSLLLLFFLGLAGSVLTNLFSLPEDFSHVMAIMTGLVVYGSYTAPEAAAATRAREEEEKKRRLDGTEQ